MIEITDSRIYNLNITNLGLGFLYQKQHAGEQNMFRAIAQNNYNAHVSNMIRDTQYTEMIENADCRK